MASETATAGYEDHPLPAQSLDQDSAAFPSSLQEPQATEHVPNLVKEGSHVQQAGVAQRAPPPPHQPPPAARIPAIETLAGGGALARTCWTLS